MGICSSFDSTAGAPGAGAAGATVKLVLLEGGLREFALPVRAAHVLQKDPGCFVCNADDMEFEDFVAPVEAEDELQLGQLYFLLPISMLRRRLQADEMAALAVKASAALMDAASVGHRGLVFPDPGAGKGGAGVRPQRGRRRSGSRRGSRDYKPELSGIPE